MEHQLFTKMDPAQRADALKDNCDVIEQMSYLKRFSHEELSECKTRLSDVDIEKNDIEEEKAEVAKGYKKRLEPIDKERKDLLKNIKQKGITVTEEVFKFVDQEAGEVGYYNAVGDLIQQRPILPSERQTNIFNLRQANADK